MWLGYALWLRCAGLSDVFARTGERMSDVEKAVQFAREQNFITTHSITRDDLCYYDHISQTLHGSQKQKALKFNRLKLIQYLGHGAFICLPIKGYNKSTYTMKKAQGEWTCNCQWFVKNSLQCSHLIALFLYFRTRGKGDNGAS